MPKKLMRDKTRQSKNKTTYPLTKAENFNPMSPITRKSKTKESYDERGEIRCIERNLIYVVGIPIDYASFDLASSSYFGRFGPIDKLHCGNTIHKGTKGQIDTVGAHITFKNEHDALLCLFCCNGSFFNGSQLKASRGINKYCSSFLESKTCLNPLCSFKHSIGDPADQFTQLELIECTERYVNMARPNPPYNIAFKYCDLLLDEIPKQPDFPDPIHEYNGLSFPTDQTDTESEKSLSGDEQIIELQDEEETHQEEEEIENDFEEEEGEDEELFEKEKEEEMIKPTESITPVVPEILLPDDDVRIPLCSQSEPPTPDWLVPDPQILDFWAKIRAEEPEINREREQKERIQVSLAQYQAMQIWPPRWHPKIVLSKLFV